MTALLAPQAFSRAWCCTGSFSCVQLPHCPGQCPAPDGLQHVASSANEWLSSEARALQVADQFRVKKAPCFFVDSTSAPMAQIQWDVNWSYLLRNIVDGSSLELIQSSYFFHVNYTLLYIWVFNFQETVNSLDIKKNITFFFSIVNSTQNFVCWIILRKLHSQSRNCGF